MQLLVLKKKPLPMYLSLNVGFFGKNFDIPAPASARACFGRLGQCGKVGLFVFVLHHSRWPGKVVFRIMTMHCRYFLPKTFAAS
jgi:hypothetical protein